MLFTELLATIFLKEQSGQGINYTAMRVAQVIAALLTNYKLLWALRTGHNVNHFLRSEGLFICTVQNKNSWWKFKEIWLQHWKHPFP